MVLKLPLFPISLTNFTNSVKLDVKQNKNTTKKHLSYTTTLQQHYNKTTKPTTPQRTPCCAQQNHNHIKQALFCTKQDDFCIKQGLFLSQQGTLSCLTTLLLLCLELYDVYNKCMIFASHAFRRPALPMFLLRVLCISSTCSSVRIPDDIAEVLGHQVCSRIIDMLGYANIVPQLMRKRIASPVYVWCGD